MPPRLISDIIVRTPPILINRAPIFCIFNNPIFIFLTDHVLLTPYLIELNCPLVSI
jgi:hypothetical protein